MIENKQLPMYSIANGEYSCVCVPVFVLILKITMIFTK